jgi:phospholipase/carboxylesterase
VYDDLPGRAHPNQEVLLIQGSADPVLSVTAMRAAKIYVQKLGLNVTDQIAAGLGHSVDPVGLSMSGEFVARTPFVSL